MKRLDENKVYLITGGAGFIGFHLSESLLKKEARFKKFTDWFKEYYEY